MIWKGEVQYKLKIQVFLHLAHINNGSQEREKMHVSYNARFFSFFNNYKVADKANEASEWAIQYYYRKRQQRKNKK